MFKKVDNLVILLEIRRKTAIIHCFLQHLDIFFTVYTKMDEYYIISHGKKINYPFVNHKCTVHALHWI